MSAYSAFVKKEFMEFTRTYKLLILFSVFLLIGMMNPLTARIMPELIDNFMPEGIQIAVEEPTAMDSWIQFYKNVPQIGLIVLVIVFSGLLSQEYARDTLVNMLTKGLARRTVILSKFTMASVMWSAAYALCFGVSWGYTAYFWKGGAVREIVFAALSLWLYGVLLLAVSMLGGALFSSTYGSLLFTGGFVGLEFLMNLIPKVKQYNPLALASDNLALLDGSLKIADLTVPIVLSIVLCVVFLSLSIVVFNRKAI